MTGAQLRHVGVPGLHQCAVDEARLLTIEGVAVTCSPI